MSVQLKLNLKLEAEEAAIASRDTSELSVAVCHKIPGLCHPAN
jgi:hypothetical protein